MQFKYFFYEYHSLQHEKEKMMQIVKKKHGDRILKILNSGNFLYPAPTVNIIETLLIYARIKLNK